MPPIRFRRGLELGRCRGGIPTVRDGVPVAWLTTPLPLDHSFSTFSQNLRNLALRYGTGVQVLAHLENIPLPVTAPEHDQRAPYCGDHR